MLMSRMQAPLALSIALVFALAGCISHRQPKPPDSLAKRCTLGELDWTVDTLIDPEALRVALTFGQPPTYDGSYWLKNTKGTLRWCVTDRAPLGGSCQRVFRSITLVHTNDTYTSRGWIPGPSCLR
jgi:hypothetical protein